MIHSGSIVTSRNHWRLIERKPLISLTEEFLITHARVIRLPPNLDPVPDTYPQPKFLWRSRE
jgi:hypothetical protein